MKLKMNRRTREVLLKMFGLIIVIGALIVVMVAIADRVEAAGNELDEEMIVEEELSETEEDDEDFSGVPTDVPLEALGKSEDGVWAEIIEDEGESKSESDGEVQEEVLMELKPKDISDYPYDEDKAVALAQLMWAEARGCSMREQSLVAWTVLNRVDDQYSGTDFWSVITAPRQFAYYSGCYYEQYEYEMAVQILQYWVAEKDGIENTIRTLPHGYHHFCSGGDGHNYFGMNGFGNELYFGLGDPYENW